MKKLILIPFLLILLTGCFGYNELDNLMIINNIYIEKNTNYKMILNEVKANHEDIEIIKDYNKITLTCTKLNNCFKKFNNLSKKIYLSHIENLTLGKNINKKDIVYLIKKLSKFKELREDFFIISTKDKKILKANYLQTYLRNHKKSITFYDLKKSYINKEKIKIPILEIKEDNIKIKKYVPIDWRNSNEKN